MSAKAKKKSGAPTVKPLGDRILVQQLEAGTDKVGNIYIPDSAQEKPHEGTVVALGTGKKSKDGNDVPFEIGVGDHILYGKYSGTDIKVDGDEYLMMHESDVLAVIE